MIYFCLDKILQIVLCFARLASCASASLCKPKEPYKGSLNTRKGAVVEEDPSTFSKFVYWKQDFEWKCGPFGHNFNFKRIHSEKLQKLLIFRWRILKMWGKMLFCLLLLHHQNKILSARNIQNLLFPLEFHDILSLI